MQSIYERHGGFPTIRRVVAEFYERVLDDDKLAPHFEHVDMPRLIDHQTRFISFLTGGPAAEYSNDHLERVHARRHITLEEFNRMVELLTETLEDFDFTADDVATVRRELRKREPAIVSA
jgi:hemoglobin